jgi:hypothetical protein
MRIMVTNGNNVHSPEYHAEITAEKIISSAETAVISIAESAGFSASVARDIRKKIEAALLKHHQAVDASECAELEAKGLEHCDCELHSHDHVDETMLDEIAAAAEGTHLHHYFLRQDVREGILAEIHHETRSQMQVHRTVHRAKETLKNRPRAVE